MDYCRVTGHISTSEKVSGVISCMIKSGTYEGPYEVIPKAYEDQTLPTQDKMMSQNVHVTEIPMAEVSNPYGTTVSIAS